MQREKVHIAEPCSANWDAMPASDNGRYCASCEKVVVDFSKKTLTEIQDYFASLNGQTACGNYQERHTKNADSRWYRFLNKTELVFEKWKQPRLAILFITVLLFLSGCMRHVKGRMSAYSDDSKAKKNKTEKHR
jgi:hypothetical protein